MKLLNETFGNVKEIKNDLKPSTQQLQPVCEVLHKILQNIC